MNSSAPAPNKRVEHAPGVRSTRSSRVPFGLGESTALSQSEVNQ